MCYAMLIEQSCGGRPELRAKARDKLDERLRQLSSRSGRKPRRMRLADARRAISDIASEDRELTGGSG